MVLEKALESPLDCKEIRVHPKGDQLCILTGKDTEAGEDLRQMEETMAEDQVVR